MTETHEHPPFTLLREYPYTVGGVLAVLAILIVLQAINWAVVGSNSGRVDSLTKQLAAQQQQVAIDRKNSTVFIKTFLDAQLAECRAILDTDHRLGAAAVDPRVCVIVVATPQPKR